MRPTMRSPHRNPILAATYSIITLVSLITPYILPLISKLWTILTPSFLQTPATKSGNANHDHQYSPLANTTERPSHATQDERSSRLQDSENNTTVPRLSTGWLDGIRGIACFFVFLFHYAGHGHPNMTVSYGGNPKALSFIQLPVIRLMVHGRTMVSTFFLVSGYALSISPLKIIRQRKYETLAIKLSSSVFRRGIRLFVPALAAALTHLAAQRVGWLVMSDARWMGNHDEPYVSTWWNDICNFWNEIIVDLMNPFTWRLDTGGSRFYGPQLWTIPIEFRASVVLFITVFGVSRCKTAARIGIVSALAVYCFAVRHWEVALFMMGIVLAEWRLIVHERDVARSMTVPEGYLDLVEVGSDGDGGEYKEMPGLARRNSRRNLRRLFAKTLLVAALIFGLYMASYPSSRAKETNIYIWVAAIGPADDYQKSLLYISIGACFVVGAVSFLPSCQAVLECALIRYMGRISYALYLTHPLLITLVGHPLVNFMWKFIDKDNWVQYEGAWVLATLMFLPLVIWVADVFWRVVDVPVVNFARKVEKWCTVC